jgi:hypothetical protein
MKRKDVGHLYTKRFYGEKGCLPLVDSPSSEHAMATALLIRSGSLGSSCRTYSKRYVYKHNNENLALPHICLVDGIALLAGSIRNSPRHIAVHIYALKRRLAPHIFNNQQSEG